jgi:hypothetical protein
LCKHYAVHAESRRFFVDFREVSLLRPPLSL